MRYIPMKAAINEAGIETITIKAFLTLCKNNNITIATKTIAKNKSKITWSADSNVKSVVSFTTFNFTP